MEFLKLSAVSSRHFCICRLEDAINNCSLLCTFPNSVWYTCPCVRLKLESNVHVADGSVSFP